MFTGIITEVGTVAACAAERSGLRLEIEAPLTARWLAPGASVAVDGVCLTAVKVSRRGFSVQVIPETAQRSTLSSAQLSGGGRRVNLERPLRADGEVGGHFVQGHVDARARVAALRRSPRGVVLTVELPATLQGLVVDKGSIALNGVSLTVASVEKSGRGAGARKARFTVALIPYTIEQTNLGALKTGDFLNIEADILGKYVRTLIGKKR